MDQWILSALDTAQGPVFRFALAIAVLGTLRRLLLNTSDIAAAMVAESDRGRLWHKLRLRMLWIAFPTLILHRAGYLPSAGQLLYHTFFSCVSLVFRLCVIVVPVFMIAHVHLWERALGISWPTFPGTLADTLSYLTVVTGFLLFLGRVYSPPLQAMEPVWAFFKPLIILVPFVTGLLAMHPRWSPVDYHVILLVHVLSACVVIALLPFARFFSLQMGLTRVLPEAAWHPSEIEPPAGRPGLRPTFAE